MDRALRAHQRSRASFARLRVLLIILVAVAAMAPELILGLTVSDSFRFNFVWTEQFDAVFRYGHLYPRWMPRAWGGLGSPTFYFYPPIFFWLTAAVDTLTRGVLPPERVAPLASLFLLAASGITMRAWLRGEVGEWRALLGALAYMLAPYHLYDIYARGALAEASAYASVPLVMLGIKGIAEGRRRNIALLAIGYAALLLSHLPSALLVTVFLIAPYVAFLALRARQPWLFSARALAGGLLGIGIAAVYLIPAIGLLPYVSAGWFTSSFYRPENWYFWHIHAGSFSGRMLFIIPVSVAGAFLAGACASAGRTRETLFWATVAIALVLLIAGLVPPVWNLPGLSLVQFPWRALLLVEFLVVTLLVLSPPRLLAPLTMVGVLALILAYSGLGRMMIHLVQVTATGQASAVAAVRSPYTDATEYLPSGIKIVRGNGPDPVRIDLPRLPEARAENSAAKLQVASFDDGSMAVQIDTPDPTRVELRRFYFPSWKVRDSASRELPIAPTPNGRVVSFTVPTGQSSLTLRPGIASYERIGQILSCLSLLVLAAMFIGTRMEVWVRKQRHEPDV